MHLALFIEKTDLGRQEILIHKRNGDKTMKLSKILQTSFLSLLLAMTATTVYAGKGGNKGGNGGDEGPGPNDPVFTVVSDDPYIPAIDSHSLDGGGQIVFYDAAVDLSGFQGTFPDGSACDHGVKIGTLVVHRKDRKNPIVAELVFWFQAGIGTGGEVTHSFTMTGLFDEPENWPPAAGAPTSVSYDYWEFLAENRKAQNSDCAGDSDIPAGTWQISVERK
jgi:hypothetical protein